MISRLNDEAVFRLAHPLRVQHCLSGDLDLWPRVVGAKDWETLVATFKDPAFLLSNIALLVAQKGLTGVSRFINASSFSAGSNELGGAIASLIGVRHLVLPNPVFHVEDDLVELLQHTDLDTDIPVSFLKVPFPRCYVELGRSRDLPLHVYNSESGLHVLEGAYFEIGVQEELGALGLYVVLTGSPVGKSNAMDDATQAIFLDLSNPDLPLSQALANAYERALASCSTNGLTPPNLLSFEHTGDNLSLLAKALLYIGMPDIRKTVSLQRTELDTQIQRLKSPGKRAKLLRRAAQACDVITVHAPPTEPLTPSSSTDGLTPRAAHWRRGHYRQQAHGPLKSLRKLIFIPPVRVHGTEVSAINSPKTYRVKA